MKKSIRCVRNSVCDSIDNSIWDSVEDYVPATTSSVFGSVHFRICLYVRVSVYSSIKGIK